MCFSASFSLFISDTHTHIRFPYFSPPSQKQTTLLYHCYYERELKLIASSSSTIERNFYLREQTYVSLFFAARTVDRKGHTTVHQLAFLRESRRRKGEFPLPTAFSLSFSHLLKMEVEEVWQGGKEVSPRVLSLGRTGKDKKRGERERALFPVPVRFTETPEERKKRIMQ